MPDEVLTGELVQNGTWYVQGPSLPQEAQDMHQEDEAMEMGSPQYSMEQAAQLLLPDSAHVSPSSSPEAGWLRTPSQTINGDSEDDHYVNGLINGMPDNLPALLDDEHYPRTQQSPADELDAACRIPYGPQREAAFNRLSVQARQRARCASGRCRCPPPRDPRRGRRPQSVASQTHISLPPSIHPNLQRNVDAALHYEHGREPLGGDGTYHDRNYPLNSRYQHPFPEVVGPIPHVPWPSIMRRINAISQTPRQYGPDVFPPLQDYLDHGHLRGHYRPGHPAVWVSIPNPVHAFVPELRGGNDISSGVSYYATGIFVPTHPADLRIRTTHHARNTTETGWHQSGSLRNL